MDAEFFGEAFYGVFETEAAAEAYALEADPRLWALVVFGSGPSASGAGAAQKPKP